jgi:hypothetical protein
MHSSGGSPRPASVPVGLCACHGGRSAQHARSSTRDRLPHATGHSLRETAWRRPAAGSRLRPGGSQAPGPMARAYIDRMQLVRTASVAAILRCVGDGCDQPIPTEPMSALYRIWEMRSASNLVAEGIATIDGPATSGVRPHRGRIGAVQ